MLFNLLLLAVLTSIFKVSVAETHVWNFTTGWVDANPDGTFERQVIGFNGEWPLPTLRAKKGDTINLYLTNGFTDQNTTLHFHGLFQNGSNQMDGPEMVTQCPIPPGETMLYNFTLTQVGTFWYHSHTGGQYGDGMRAPFIIEDDDFPYEYDEEVVLSISDWYHDDYNTIIPSFLSVYNPTGAEPLPKNFLMNDTMNNTWHVEPGKTYLLRIVNLGVFVSQYLYIEDHNFTVVEVDGIYVEKNTTDMLYIAVAQRYSCLITTKNDTSKNYAFMQAVDQNLLDIVPSDLVVNVTNVMSYDDSNATPEQYYVDSIDDFLDDFYLHPIDAIELLDEPDYQIVVDVVMTNLGNGINYAFFNNITYTKPKVPTLVTAMSAGDLATNPLVYGTNVNSFVLQKDEVIEIVVNNYDTGRHPFHLHGHAFQAIARIPGTTEGDPVPYNASELPDFPMYPMRRDVFYINPQAYIVLRFKADNPGVWFFHCHIEWHLTQGLAIVLIEDPLTLQATDSQKLTDNYLDMCVKNGIPTSANAAGNSENFLDLTGQNVQVKALPSGFTAKGYVAIVFSCISGFLGIAVISWYGAADITDIEERVARDLANGLDIDIADDAFGDENNDNSVRSSAISSARSSRDGRQSTSGGYAHENNINENIYEHPDIEQSRELLDHSIH